MRIIDRARLADHLYYGFGGYCKRLYLPSTPAELRDALVQTQDEKVIFVGAGTNSVFSDEKWPGIVIGFSKMLRLEKVGAHRIVTGAGVDNSIFAQFALQQGLTGAGWMNGLPGQIGATTRMNARCYGGEMSQIVTRVVAYTLRGEERVFDQPREIFIGYKNTHFMRETCAIAEVEFTLSDRGSLDDEAILMQRCREDREKKGQYSYPSCGCIFKNDYNAGVPSGKLLDAAGVRNFGSKLLRVSPYHANFVFNEGGARSEDLIDLSLKMREKVFQKFGVWLEYEMEILGEVNPAIRQRLEEKRISIYDHPELLDLRQRS